MDFKHKISIWPLAVAVLSAAALSGCSDDSIDTPEPQGAGGAIAFTPAGTRAASTRAAALTREDVTDFAVTALYNRDDADLTARAFSDQYVVKANDNWYYEPAQYWPADAGTKIRFFALAPFSTAYNTATVTKDAGSVTGISASFAVPADVAAQQDLLYAVTEPINNAYDADGKPAATVSPVDLAFKHATAQISFKVQMAEGVDESYTAQISSISLYTIGSGTILLPVDPSGTATWTVERDFRSGASFGALTQYHLYPGKGLLAANGSYTDAKGNTVDAYNIATAARPNNSGTGNGLDAATAPNGSAVSITNPTTDGDNPAGYLFLIPQQPPIITLAKPSQLVEPVFNITYRLDNGLTGDQYLWTDKSVSFSLSDLHLGKEGKTYSDLTQPKDDSTDTPDWPWIWEPGKAYCYVITISTADVTLNILPTDWIDGNNGHDEYVFN